MFSVLVLGQIIHIINNLLFPVSDHPGRFNDKSLETIANCWPNMRYLSVGGPSLSSAGLIHIGKHYQPSCRIIAYSFLVINGFLSISLLARTLGDKSSLGNI